MDVSHLGGCLLEHLVGLFSISIDCAACVADYSSAIGFQDRDVRHLILVELIAKCLNSSFVVRGVSDVEPLVWHFSEMSLESLSLVFAIDADEQNL